MVSRRLVSALGGGRADCACGRWPCWWRPCSWGAARSSPSRSRPRASGPDRRTYLKQDGGKWFEVRKGPAGLEQRPSAAPRAAAPAAPQALLSAAPSGLFEPYTAIATGSWPEAVAIGDVTGDGRNDVALVTSFYFDAANDYKLFVFPQLPDGTLDAPVKYPAAGTYTSSPETVAIGDVNGDGRNDVVVGNGGDAIGVFYQNASGTLDPVSLHPTVDSKCVRIADLNHDGRLDIVGAGRGTDTVTVLLQQAGGTLAAPVVYSAPHGGYDDLEVGDLNGDGWTDVAVMSGQGCSGRLGAVPAAGRQPRRARQPVDRRGRYRRPRSAQATSVVTAAATSSPASTQPSSGLGVFDAGRLRGPARQPDGDIRGRRRARCGRGGGRERRRRRRRARRVQHQGWASPCRQRACSAPRCWSRCPMRRTSTRTGSPSGTSTATASLTWCSPTTTAGWSSSDMLIRRRSPASLRRAAATSLRCS